jgi:hypothetical protein
MEQGAKKMSKDAKVIGYKGSKSLRLCRILDRFAIDYTFLQIDKLDEERKKTLFEEIIYDEELERDLQLPLVWVKSHPIFEYTEHDIKQVIALFEETESKKQKKKEQY